MARAAAFCLVFALAACTTTTPDLHDDARRASTLLLTMPIVLP